MTNVNSRKCIFHVINVISRAFGLQLVLKINAPNKDRFPTIRIELSSVVLLVLTNCNKMFEFIFVIISRHTICLSTTPCFVELITVQIFTTEIPNKIVSVHPEMNDVTIYDIKMFLASCSWTKVARISLETRKNGSIQQRSISLFFRRVDGTCVGAIVASGNRQNFSRSSDSSLFSHRGKVLLFIL